MAVSPAGLSRTPSVLAAGVTEWPVPVILIGRPSAAAFVTSAATSAADPGIRTRAGLAETLPAQLRQEVASWLFMVKPPPGQGKSGSGGSTQFCLLLLIVGPQPATPRNTDQDAGGTAACRECETPSRPDGVDDVAGEGRTHSHANRDRRAQPRHRLGRAVRRRLPFQDRVTGHQRGRDGEPGDEPDRIEHQQPRHRPEGRYPSDRERGRGREPPPERRRPVPRPIPEPASRAAQRVRPEYEARHRPVPEVGGERHGTEVNGGEHRPEKQEGWCERDQAGGWQARPADRAEPLPRPGPPGGVRGWDRRTRSARPFALLSVAGA